MTADEVLDVRSWLPEGAYVQAAVVLVQYVFPGEDDEEERGPWFDQKRDEDHGAWNHLGMVEACANDLRRKLSRVAEES